MQKGGKRKLSSKDLGFKKQRIDSIAGFCVLCVKCKTTPFQKYIYYKEHKEKNLSPGKTLFITNLAIDTTQQDLINIFSVYGEVSEVHLDSFRKKSPTLQRSLSVDTTNQPSITQKLIFQEKQKKFEANITEEDLKLPFSSAGYAHLVFKEEESLTKAIRSPVVGVDHSELGGELKGFEKWLEAKKAEVNIDMEKLEKEANDFMTGYDTRKFQFQKRLEQLTSYPDEDGWVTVTKGKKKSRGNTAAIGVAKVDQQTLKKLIEKEKKKHKTDFYRFQRTEQANTHIQELRKRFDQDRKRIEKLREGRKFKPF